MMFGLSKRKDLDELTIVGGIAGQLWTMLNSDRTKLAQPLARFVLKKDSSVNFYNDIRNPKYVLGWGDLAFVLIREDQDALQKWVDDMKLFSGSPELQLAATEEFAKVLSVKLINAS